MIDDKSITITESELELVRSVTKLSTATVLRRVCGLKVNGANGIIVDAALNQVRKHQRATQAHLLEIIELNQTGEQHK